jgi:hypothetical protein
MVQREHIGMDMKTIQDLIESCISIDKKGSEKES